MKQRSWVVAALILVWSSGASAGGDDDIVVRRPRPRFADETAPAPWVSVDVFRQRTPVHGEEVGGFLVVGLPLDRMARTRVPNHLPPAVLPALLEATPVIDGATIDLSLGPRLARACVGAAWRAAGLGADDARLEAIVSRARWSGLLPEARLRATRYDVAQLALYSGAETSNLRDTAGANVGLEARLTWRLDRLLYADDEPAFERIRIDQRDARSRIAAKALEALFHWQRAVLDLRTLPPSQQGTRDEADVILRVVEAESALDVLTDGWFVANRPRTDPKRPTLPQRTTSARQDL